MHDGGAESGFIHGRMFTHEADGGIIQLVGHALGEVLDISKSFIGVDGHAHANI